MEEAKAAAGRAAELAATTAADPLAQAIQASSRADEVLEVVRKRANEDHARVLEAIEQEVSNLREAGVLANDAASSVNDTQRLLESSRRVPDTPHRATYTAATKAVAALEEACAPTGQ